MSVKEDTLEGIVVAAQDEDRNATTGSKGDETP